jgi:SAM-dependent methyltransferase
VFRPAATFRERKTRNLDTTRQSHARWCRDCAVSGQFAPYDRIAGEVVSKFRVWRPERCSLSPFLLSRRCFRRGDDDQGGPPSHSLAPVREYYEELWARLPEVLTPPDLELRRRFLRTGVRAGDRALDLGCGEGTFIADLQTAGAASVTGADVAEAALDRARAHHPGIESQRVPFDGPLPFADGSFDLVWASEVIEHVADTARFLSEVRRVLAPGGRLLITTPGHGRLRLLVSGVEPYLEPLGDHLHLYTQRSLRTVLEEFGFDGVEIKAAGGAPGLRRLLLARARR